MAQFIRPGESLSTDYCGLPEFFEFDNWDGRWTKFNCGQAAACSLLRHYGRVESAAEAMQAIEREFPPDNLGGWLGTSRSRVEQICRVRGIPLQEIRGEEAFRQCLSRYQPLIVMLGLPGRVRILGFPLPVGHWMVAYGFDESFVYLSNWGRMAWDDFRHGWRSIVPRLIRMHQRGLVIAQRPN